jgi:hypothetical protein
VRVGNQLVCRDPAKVPVDGIVAGEPARSMNPCSLASAGHQAGR